MANMRAGGMRSLLENLGHAGADSEKIAEVWNLVGDAAPYVTVSQELFFKRAGEAVSCKAENHKLRKENCTRVVLYCPLCLISNPPKAQRMGKQVINVKHAPGSTFFR